MSFSSEEVEAFLQIARDATLGSSFSERMDSVTQSLEPLLPHSSLSVILLAPAADGPAAGGKVFWRNGPTEHARLYAEHYVQADPMGPAIPRGDGKSYVLTDFVRESEFGRDALTGEYCLQVNIHHIMGCSHSMPDGVLLSIAIHRERLMSNFSEREREVLRIVSPDLARAAFGVLVREKIESDLAREALSSQDAGVGVFDATGDVLKMDPAARALLAQARASGALSTDDLVADVRHLATSRAREGDALERSLRLADGRWVKLRLMAMATQGGSNVLCMIQPLAPGSAEYVMLVARDAGLTPRELEVARLAIEGLGNRRIGRLLGVSPVTVGCHLTRIYAKLGVPGRVELTHRLLGGPSVVEDRS